MSLSAHERRVLHDIDDRIRTSDPRLASLLATFSRLTAAEEMPAREQVRRAALGALGGVLLWFAIVLGLIAVALAVSYSVGSTSTCTWSATCPGQMSAPVR